MTRPLTLQRRRLQNLEDATAGTELDILTLVLIFLFFEPGGDTQFGDVSTENSALRKPSV